LAKITLDGNLVDSNNDAIHASGDSAMSIKYLLESTDDGVSWHPYVPDT
jgi:hypothetical protein